MANFGALVPSGYDSLVFPVHCQQVFFSDDEDEPGLKVVLRTEVRGHRVDVRMEEEEEPPMFAMGQDSNFEGLQVPVEDPETYPNAIQGRDIQMNEFFNRYVEEPAVISTETLESHPKKKSDE